VIRKGRSRPTLGDERGATLVEFALVVPVLLMLIMGMCELAHQIYVQATLSGAVEKAGRDSGLESYLGNSAALDAKVELQVHAVAANAAIIENRSSFSNFASIGAEPYVDANKNGQYDAGESFTDINCNGVWDSFGVSGQGGANDAVVYKVTATYNRLFPLLGRIGLPNPVTLTAQTILKNQPYQTQTTLCGS
jgi:Flp pilus assembly pilin Flp